MSNQDKAIAYFKTHSNDQAKFAEYFFLKDLIAEAACLKESVCISRSDFDAFGFDVLLARKGKVVMVQMKAYSGKASNWDVYKSLLQSDAGRLVVVKLTAIKGVIQPEYFLFDKRKLPATQRRPPKVPHPEKCKVNRGELLPITNNLLKVFE